MILNFSIIFHNLQILLLHNMKLTKKKGGGNRIKKKKKEYKQTDFFAAWVCYVFYAVQLSNHVPLSLHA